MYDYTFFIIYIIFSLTYPTLDAQLLKMHRGANTKKEDPKLLKKALKRKAKKKAASAKAWNVRVEQVQDSKFQIRPVLKSRTILNAGLQNL